MHFHPQFLDQTSVIGGIFFLTYRAFVSFLQENPLKSLWRLSPIKIFTRKCPLYSSIPRYAFDSFPHGPYRDYNRKMCQAVDQPIYQFHRQARARNIVDQDADFVVQSRKAGSYGILTFDPAGNDSSHLRHVFGKSSQASNKWSACKTKIMAEILFDASERAPSSIATQRGSSKGTEDLIFAAKPPGEASTNEDGGDLLPAFPWGRVILS